MVARRRSVLALSLVLLLGGVPDVVTGAGTTDRLVEFYQARVARDPDDFLSYNKLGAVYIQKARESGDVTYYDLAEKALLGSLTLVPEGPAATAARTSLALVHLARHQFAEALALAQKAAQSSGDLYPYAIIGDAWLEMGEDEKASLAYAKMLTLSGPLHPHHRLAEVKFLRGDPTGAVESMRQAIAATIEASAPKENIAWGQVRLAEVFFQVGDLARAEAACQGALSTYPGYHRALASLARVRAAQRRLPDAIELYRKAIAIIPLPEYAAALGDVYVKSGRPQEARKQYDLVEYVGLLNRLNKTIYNRELALFYADHDLKPKQAVDLAEKELEVRRDVYTWDVVAWTRYKNGQTAEALAAMTQALRLGTRDARLFFHAGMIHHRLGDTEKARDYLGRALATNPHFHVFQADVAAGTLKQLGDRGR